MQTEKQGYYTQCGEYIERRYNNSPEVNGSFNNKGLPAMYQMPTIQYMLDIQKMLACDQNIIPLLVCHKKFLMMSICLLRIRIGVNGLTMKQKIFLWKLLIIEKMLGSIRILLL